MNIIGPHIGAVLGAYIYQAFIGFHWPLPAPVDIPIGDLAAKAKGSSETWSASPDRGQDSKSDIKSDSVTLKAAVSSFQDKESRMEFINKACG